MIELTAVLLSIVYPFCRFFFFNDTATTEIYTLSLHDALPILGADWKRARPVDGRRPRADLSAHLPGERSARGRSEEHTSELQSHSDLVCRLLLEKKKKPKRRSIPRVD